MLGYGQTSAPDSPKEYTLKKMASHIATIIKAHTDQPVIIGGHDWGSALVWRVAMYHPGLVRAVFGFCFPYLPASPNITTHEKLVEKYPHFRYQLSNRAGAIEAAIGDSHANLLRFLSGAFGGRTPEGQPVFDPENGIYPDRLPRIGAPYSLDKEMLDYYVQEYSRHGLHGPCNWYRTHELNTEDELAFAEDHPDFKFKVPAMIVMASKDGFLPLYLADDAETYFTAGIKKGVVDCVHWGPAEKPEESNEYIKDFLASVVGEDLKPQV